MAIERAAITNRLSEVHKLWLYIKHNESSATPPIDIDEIKMVRGLFFVSLYGAYERSVNESVVQYFTLINSLGISYNHFSGNFYPAAFDSMFTSLRTSEQKWKKRVEFGAFVESSEVCQINSGVFEDQLQNPKSKILKMIAEYLGASQLYNRNHADELYLDEVVEKRNQVAHGRNTAIVVGSTGRSDELVIRYQAISRILESFVQMLENHYLSKDYIRPPYRGQYN
ncbi:MAE_28990/MAE_18760 family HEPN-like nuclease [Pseudoduganella chitinolytica]|uniref:MAE_28990/MAE_18760 family HEPN-like nuclease n=1 Tax=Pseudoduganella chitinolytica TaxID=34070 RepID=A0ABY8BAF8_9BURK|nr:MAE_28990/MAE_18760 family HEPN-like nuclease [Pseudoduganella chitinolytica]WEF32423.1 MAE_28990/MAE_18760 family HEPN-like nuclease [Pseudoduganella chitinolytica]